LVFFFFFIGEGGQAGLLFFFLPPSTRVEGLAPFCTVSCRPKSTVFFFFWNSGRAGPPSDLLESFSLFWRGEECRLFLSVGPLARLSFAFGTFFFYCSASYAVEMCALCREKFFSFPIFPEGSWEGFFFFPFFLVITEIVPFFSLDVSSGF